MIGIQDVHIIASGRQRVRPAGKVAARETRTGMMPTSILSARFMEGRFLHDTRTNDFELSFLFASRLKPANMIENVYGEC